MSYYPYASETGAIYRLVGPNGAVAVFNDPLDPQYVGMLSEVTGLDSADVRESAEDLVEADGGTHGNFYFSRRPIILNGRIFGHSSVAERNRRMDLARRASLALRADATLSWKPSTRREQLVANPTFGGDTSGYTPINGTLNWFATGGIGGGSRVRVTATGAAYGISYGETTPGTHYLAVTPGKAYTASAQVLATTVANQIALTFYNAAGAVTGSVASPSAATARQAWIAGVAPAGSVYAIITVTTTTGVSGNTMDVDQVMLLAGNYASAPTYFDGDTAGYYWQGTPHASASGDFIEMFTEVRRQQPFRETGAWNKDFQVQLVSQYAPLFSAAQRVASGASGSPVAAENRGSWPSYPLIEITGVSSNPAVVNATNGSSISTTGLFLSGGETVQVDTLNHVAYFSAGARAGQSANRYINFGGIINWLNIGSGDNSLVLSGSGSMNVLWRDSWM
jgi:hypothetical protein